MSILTSDDPNKIMNLIKKLIQFNIILSVVSYAAGIVLFFYFIHEPMKTSFHDNSLLPGLANREFVDSQLSEQYLNRLDNVSAYIPKNVLPLNFLKEQFENIGLEVYEHRFTFANPFQYTKKRKNGTNIYAIFRAPRTASTESIVISVPYRAKNKAGVSTYPAIALILSLAKFFKEKNYWAKDIIYLIYGNELFGIQAWLQSYQELNYNAHIQSDYLIAKAGTIQSGLILELESFNPPFIQLKLEGFNGQLPNLDLFNVAVELCNRESVPVSFHGDSFYHTENEWANWLRKGRTMLSMMNIQASMLSNGAHGLFQKYSVSAITLEGQNKKSKYMMVANLSLGRAIEGIIRSLNNMMEKFNRSFYFYLLASTRRFISISSYMIVFALLAAPLAFRSLHYYFQSSLTEHSNFSLWIAFKPCFFAHLFGLLALSFVPLFLTRLNNKFIASLLGENISVENTAYSLYLTLALLTMNSYQTSQPKSMNQYCLQSMIALLNTLLLFSAISLINISLALALTLIYVPLLTFVSIQDHRHYQIPTVFNLIKKLLKYMSLLLIHPISIHFVSLLISSIWSKANYKLSDNYLKTLDQLLVHLKEAFFVQPKMLLNYMEQWYLFDNWAFPMIVLFIYPVWLQLWLQARTMVIQ